MEKLDYYDDITEEELKEKYLINNLEDNKNE